MFSVRIVTVNHYQAQPIRDLDVAYSDFRGSEVKQVPVLRVFGATPLGQKTCLHIHGVFPYFYVKCGPQEFATDKDLRQFATSLDLALQVAMGKASGNTQHVFKVVGVQAVPMYGYHSRSRRFLKVYFYNPLMVKRAVELLQSGAVMNKVFQPHEAHIPFILQFFIDYNLYGMNLIHLAAVKFRREKNENDDRDTPGSHSETSSTDTQPVNLSSVLSASTISSQRWGKENIPSGLLLDAEIQKQSVCELEVDAVAIDILNRHELQGNTEMNPGLLAIYNEEKERREVKGQLDDLHPPASPDRGVIEDTDSEVHGKARLADIIQKQLDELRVLAGDAGDDDNESLLHDTLAEPSLTASQLIVHDSQYAGDEDSISNPEEESQPVVNEELVQSLVEASQRSSQYSQQAGGDDEDLAQLLVDLAQDGGPSPEDGSILSSQDTQDEQRQEEQNKDEDEDARESLEMSQAWDDGSDGEDTVEESTTHDISASEEDTQDSQAVTIPQFDGGSDEKQEPAKKKSLGIKRQLPKVAPNLHQDALGSHAATFSPFPPQIKTYSHKKQLLSSPGKAWVNTGLASSDTREMQKSVFQRARKLAQKPGIRKKTGTPPGVVNLHKVPKKPVEVRPAAASKSKRRRILSGASLKTQWLQELARDKLLSKDPGAIRSQSSSEWKVVEKVTQGRSSANHIPPGNVQVEASLVRDPASDTNTAPQHQAGSSKLHLVKVPYTAGQTHFKGCEELKGYSSVGDVKKDPMWNPVVMLMKCPIETDSKGRITCSGTSLPQQQLEQIRKENLKAMPFRRSSFSRKIVPPKKFMDEQYWMDQIEKASKQKTLEQLGSSPQKLNTGSTPKIKRRRPHKQIEETAEKDRVQVTVPDKSEVQREDASEIAKEPPCLMSPAQLASVKDNLPMPVLEKIAAVGNGIPAQQTCPEKQTVVTKTKAMLQEKYYKSLNSSDKHRKLSRKGSHGKLFSERDAKRYGMLSRTFNKLSLTPQEPCGEPSCITNSEAAQSTAVDPGISKSETSSPVTSVIPTSSSISNFAMTTTPSSHLLGVGLSPGQSSSFTALFEPLETTKQIKKSSPGSRKRRGSDSSDDWAERRKSHKRKSSQGSNSNEDPWMFGRTYGFRKRERISYDEGDFPDVGFEIMCWSDEEDSVELLPQRSHMHSETRTTELLPEPQPHQQSQPLSEPRRFDKTMKSSSSVLLACNQTAKAVQEQQQSPPRKRGRPCGSKKKSKLLSSPSSRHKQHLSFTVDSLPYIGSKPDKSRIGTMPTTASNGENQIKTHNTNLEPTMYTNNVKHSLSQMEPVFTTTSSSTTQSTSRMEPVPTTPSNGTKHTNWMEPASTTTGNCATHNNSLMELAQTRSAKPIMITATSHSSLGGPLPSIPTATQAKVVQSDTRQSPVTKATDSQLSTSVSTNDQHRPRSRPEPVPTTVNGHHSSIHDDDSEPTLYRDAMWNLGYFSPHRNEREGSPPRCWSPSIDRDSSRRAQHASEGIVEITPKHKPSKVQKPWERMKLIDQKKESKKKAADTNRGKSQSGTAGLKGKNQTDYTQLNTSNSRTSNSRSRSPESKHLCNTDNFDEGEPVRSETFEDKQENKMEVDQTKADVTSEEQKESTHTDGHRGVEASRQEEARNGFTSCGNSHPDDLANENNYKTETGNNEIPILSSERADKTSNPTSSQTKPGDSPELNNTLNSCTTLKEADVDVGGTHEERKEVALGSVQSSRVAFSEKTEQSSPVQLSLDSNDTTNVLASVVGVKNLEKNQSVDVLTNLTATQNGVTAVTENASPDDSALMFAEDSEASTPSPDTKKAASLHPSHPEVAKMSQSAGHSDGYMTCVHGQAQMPQRKSLDDCANSSAMSDIQTSDLDSSSSATGSELLSKPSSGTEAEHRPLSPDVKALGDGGTPNARSLSSSSDDITPAQRLRRSPSQEVEEEDSDNICNMSHGSSSTGASLSLDMSLIISRVPSISPTRELLESERSSLQQDPPGSPEAVQEKITKDYQKTEQKASSVSETADHWSQFGESSGALDLSQDTWSTQDAVLKETGSDHQRSRHPSDHVLMDDGSLTPTLISGKQTDSSGLSACSFSEIRITCARTLKNGSVAVGEDQTKRHLLSGSNSDDSDTFSQLVCPETPSPRASLDPHRSSQKKPCSQSDTPSSGRPIPVTNESKTQRYLSSPAVEKLTVSSTGDACEEPLNLSSPTKKESALKLNSPSSPRIVEEADSDEEVEAMEIDLSQEESGSLNLSTRHSPSYQVRESHEQSQHPEDIRHLHRDREATDRTSTATKSEWSSSLSGEDPTVYSGHHFQPPAHSDSTVTKKTAINQTSQPGRNDESLTSPPSTDQTQTSALHQDSLLSTREIPVSSAFSAHPSQQTDRGHQHKNNTHPVEDDVEDKAVQNQAHDSSQSTPVYPGPPLASSLESDNQNTNQTQNTHQTTSRAEEMPNLTSFTEAKSTIWTPSHCPPSAEMVRASLQEYGLPQFHHQRAFCGNPDDAHHPSKPGVHNDGHLQSNLPSRLPEAESRLSQTGLGQWQANLMALQPHPLLSASNVAPEPGLKAALLGEADAVITPCRSPPSCALVRTWLEDKNDKRPEDAKYGDKETNGTQLAEKPVKEKVTRFDPANKTSSSKGPSQGFPEEVSQSNQDRRQSAASATQACQQLQDEPSTSKIQTPKGYLPHWQKNSTPSTKPDSTPQGGSPFSSPTPWKKNSIQPRLSTPGTNPLSRRGSSQPQHSTPLRVDPGTVEASLPLTPISGWKRPLDPSSAGGSRERHPSSSSMRQTLLFTPKESSGVGGPGREMSQIEGATPSNTCGFKMPQLNMQDAKTMHEVQHLTVLSLELHVKTRRDYCPDPDFDPIRALFYSIQHDKPVQDSAGCSQQDDGFIHGVVIVDDSNHGNGGGASTSSSAQASLAHAGISNVFIKWVATETDLLDELLAIIRKHDPDILVGYEVQQLSWGYLLQRAAFLDMDLCTQISRLPDFKKESSFSAERDAYGADHQSEINIAGRITLNLWRLMRHEVALTNYTFENVAFHVLHQRVPLFTFRKLTDWFDHRNAQLFRWRVIEYYSVRVRGSLKLLHQLDLIGRTSELARVFGIQFYSVLSRGSQFRVESMMLRTAKPQNYVAMSPSVQQRSRMKAPECIPLVMEPESRFYQDPVIVLDFQSLYPTMMIAYNYCYSTCLGRLEHIANGGEYALGCGSLSVSVSQLKKLYQSDSLHVSPNGIVFVKPSVRRGVLPMMLEQILKLRLIVKKSLKDFKDDKTLHRMLNSRQLALKLIANVTYGYTSANFSGRMPCIEVGDSVVRKGRETLERAIHMVESTKKWGARVVYGDTDSMFVLVEGASKERAFEVGREIRDAVTAANPKPVKLKLEKVYHPCVLQSKKRYVGYSYESPDQVEPEFDAKGIETVRRDSCPAVGKILERALKILFTTRDVSQIKQYVQKQFQKILDGQATMQDLVFAKEYRGKHTYRPGACVPALEISRRLLAVDRRAEPRVGQRVPYVIVHGSPGLPLIQLVRTPGQVLQDPSLRLNTTYYLTRQLVPTLNRVFGLLGVDTMQWYQELPRWHRVNTLHQLGTPGKKGTISQYFVSLNCVICEKVTKESLCSDCKAKGQVTATALLSRVQQWQSIQQDMAKICASCCNFKEQDTSSCVSLDCPIMFKTNKLARQLGQAPYYLQLLDGL
ncbi:DNA polymerase zeta catalytic subunit-like [Patiria miniata]|uniref:DNA polymerase zeta catalytic subunit n=1 Tax=Patiria miniata TaxID=46514 RepID=A0A914A693_PATMI|nr:DNA polymerase zeta catalytic subunit-like [Patiria miniata]